MNLPQYLRSFSILAVAFFAILAGFSSLPSLTLKPLSQEAQALEFPPSGKNRGAPRTSTGGGTRGDETACITTQAGEIPLVALMPNRENTSKTATKTPTLYWYIPQTTANSGEFVIIDENKQEIYYTSFFLPSEAGIVKLTIPPQTSLEAGKTYTWSFMIVCDTRYRNRDKFVQGKLEYVQLTPEQNQQLTNAKGLEKAKLAALSNLWPETLDAIAQLRTDKPAEWQELLKSVGLEGLTDKPFVECCTAQ